MLGTGDGPHRLAEFDDTVVPFQIESAPVRGRVVRLGHSLDTILGHHDYPEPVAVMLAEGLVLAAVLSSGLKFDGVFSLQVKGDGPIRLLVADITTDGRLRGYAQFDRQRLARLRERAPHLQPDSVPKLLGAGYLAFTVDQGVDSERYQGIVELEGATLTDCAHAYFRRSEQVRTAVKIAVGKPLAASGKTGWRAGGLMVQCLPTPRGEADDAMDEDAWRRAVVLMASSTEAELLDPEGHPHQLLFRLFHEDGVRAFGQNRLSFGCRCSRQRVERTLRSFPQAEIAEMKIDDRVIVTCEFCNRFYVFNDDDLDALYELVQD